MSAKPVRLQLSRKRGFNLQALSQATNGLEAVNVARPTKWGNPFVVHHPGSYLEKPMHPAMAVSSFKALLSKGGGWFPVPLPWPKGKIPKQYTSLADVRCELAGKNLACWCALPEPGQPDICHAAVLLELANPGASE